MWDRLHKRRLAAGIAIGLALALAIIWLATTETEAIWPVRNTLQYHFWSWWTAGLPATNGGSPGALAGTVRDQQSQPVAGAWVLVAGRAGTTYTGRSEATGRYTIAKIPPGTYYPITAAPGYEMARFGGLFGQVKVKAETQTNADVWLRLEPVRPSPASRDLWLAEPETLTCTRPLEAKAVRRRVHFKIGDRPNQPTFYYTPETIPADKPLPMLLTVYPGPADTWDCVSLPLAAAGYAVLAAGPAYSFDIEADIDELEGLLAFARTGQFPSGDGSRLAVLGGSYSAVLVQRLLQRDQDFQAAILLGPPTDLFDMRRRLEQGTFRPPFGLDQALIALGFPDREPLRYGRYSGAYHVRADFPPIALLHSRSDEIVPYQQSELLANNLAELDVPHEIHFFEGGSHYLLAKDDDALEMYRLTLGFLAKHLNQ
ncbi:MAG TPA: prolyl oligopeptidase family serine peptidase [Anaerolineae bacterium]|jgi:acetyl esterase/lipase